MNARTRHYYAEALRGYVVVTQLLKIETAAAAAGRHPGPEFDQAVRDARRAVLNVRHEVAQKRMEIDTARAHRRFIARHGGS